LGIWRWARLPGTHKTDKGGLWKQSVCPCGSYARGICREDSFTGDPEGYVKEGTGNSYLSPQRPLVAGPWKGP
jgi:hypothetical protein